MSGVTDALVVWGYRAAWRAVRLLPERVAYRLFDVVADRTTARGGEGVRTLRRNYSRVRPELDDTALDTLVAEGMRSYLRYWCEAFRLPDLDRADLARAVRVVGAEPLRAEFAAGRPVVCFLGHLGNWDLAGAWGTVELAPVVTVAERLRPEQVFEEFVEFREALGMRILPLTGGGDVFAELRALLTGPVLVPLLADRDLTHRGIEVELCGHPARAAIGPAALALASRAALHPASIHYEPFTAGLGGRRTVITFHERVHDPGEGSTRERVLAMTQQCVDTLGTEITAHTEDWHMMQRVFTEDLDPARLARPGRRP